MEITLFEYERIEFDWTDEDRLKILKLEEEQEKLEKKLDRGEKITLFKLGEEGGKRYLTATQYVGVFRLGSRTLQVLPKMYRSPRSESNHRQALRNLLYMLGYVNRLDIEQEWLDSLQAEDLNWYEVLTQLFASNLLTQWHKGAVRSYQSISDTLPVLKGKWNLTKQLCHPERKHLFSVTYDEFTADNHLNQIFRYVVERLWKSTQNLHIRQDLNRLRQSMDEVTLLPSINIENTKQIDITRLNQRYEPLLNLARLFLRNQSLELFAGNVKAYTFAFMIDMNQLFEDFVISFIERNRHEIIPQHLHNCKFRSQAAGVERYMAIKKSNERSVFKIKPDLIIQNNDEFPMIIDTKYKTLQAEDSKLGVSQADFYQMYAYSQRYNSPYILLIYPQTVNMPEPLQATFKTKSNFQNDECDRTIIATTIDLRGDLSKQDEKDKLLNRLKELLQY